MSLKENLEWAMLLFFFKDKSIPTKLFESESFKSKFYILNKLCYLYT